MAAADDRKAQRRRMIRAHNYRVRRPRRAHRQLLIEIFRLPLARSRAIPPSADDETSWHQKLLYTGDQPLGCRYSLFRLLDRHLRTGAGLVVGNRLEILGAAEKRSQLDVEPWLVLR